MYTHTIELVQSPLTEINFLILKSWARLGVTKMRRLDSVVNFPQSA
jgi:hypothetical protein